MLPLAGYRRHPARTWRPSAFLAGPQQQLTSPKVPWRAIQACNLDWTKFRTTPFPWASTSFRPRHIQPTVAAFAPLFRFAGLRAAEVSAACSAAKQALRLTKLLGCSPSLKAGCERACRTPCVLTIWSHQILSEPPTLCGLPSRRFQIRILTMHH